MPVRQEDRAHAATAPTDPGPSALLVMTSLGAVDGTIVLLAAQGALAHWMGALSVGLTVTAGAGAWITARQAFGGRRRSGRDWGVLAAIALVTGLTTVAAAWLGGTVGTTLPLQVLPHAAGIILLGVAAEIGGLRFPGTGPLPLPAVAVLGALVAEGVAQWTL